MGKRKWRSLRSVPVDGTVFDAWCVDPFTEDVGVRFTDVSMRGDGSGFGIILDDGSWEYLLDEGVYPSWLITYWMPQPKPPKEGANE